MDALSQITLTRKGAAANPKELQGRLKQLGALALGPSAFQNAAVARASHKEQEELQPRERTHFRPIFYISLLSASRLAAQALCGFFFNPIFALA
jgi:hypothetical protein